MGRNDSEGRFLYTREDKAAIIGQLIDTGEMSHTFCL